MGTTSFYYYFNLHQLNTNDSNFLKRSRPTCTHIVQIRILLYKHFLLSCVIRAARFFFCLNSTLSHMYVSKSPTKLQFYNAAANHIRFDMMWLRHFIVVGRVCRTYKRHESDVSNVCQVNVYLHTPRV